MSCTLATLAACFSFSNLYVDGGILWQDREDARFRSQFESTSGTITPGSTVGVQANVIDDAARNPYGRFSIGYSIDMRSLMIALEGSHVSSTRAGWDTGVNAIEVRARWYPFRR